MENVSAKSSRETKNTRFIFISFLKKESYFLWDNVEKYYRAGQAKEDNMVHAHCMLDT